MNTRTLSPDGISLAIPAVEVGEKVFTDSHRELNINGDLILNNSEGSGTDQDSYPPDTRNRSDDTHHYTLVPPSENAGVPPFNVLFDRQGIHQDKGMSPEEFAAAWSKAIKERFAKLNANGDGVSNKDKRVTNRNVEGGPPRSPWDSTT